MACTEILQNKAAKIILDKPMYSSSLKTLADLHWHELCHRRCKNNFRLPKVNTNWGKQRIECHAANEWNNLPNELKQFSEIGVFKKRIF